MNIILVDNDDSARQLSGLIAENIFESPDITEFSEGNAAIEFLKENKVDLIIFDWDLSNGDAGKLIGYLDNTEYQGSCLFYSERDVKKVLKVKHFLEISLRFGYLQKPSGTKALEDALREISLPTYVLEDRDGVDEKYKKVRISYFWRYNQALCDIYLRLSEFKYVKIINKEDIYDKDLIDKYLKKNQKFLFIKVEDFESFSSSIASYPFLSFVDEDNLPDDPSKIENSAKMTHAILQDLVTTVGISKNAIKMADLYVNLVNKMAGDGNSLSQLLLKMRSKKDYLYDHSYMVSCVSAYMCKELEWHTAQTIEKLCLASLFHDITLTDPEMAMLSDLEELNIKDYSSEEKDIFLNHTKDAAKLVSKTREFPIDVDTIILQHHEKPDGAGFPNQVSAEMTSPLIAVFVMAHDFITQLYENDFDETQYDQIVSLLEAKYDVGNYRGVIEAFKKSVGSALDM